MQVDVDVFERRSGVPDALVALGIEVRIESPEQALAAASGVSTVTARRLLEEFGSLIEVLQTSPQELCRVPGVGAKRALAIQQLARSN